MTALKEVFIYEFYRRNYLFFLLIAIFLVFVVRPPSLLVSPYFMEAMLESQLFFGIVTGLLSAYYIKCAFELLRAIHSPENRFLYQLGAIPLRERWTIMLKQLLGVSAPAFGYMSVIAVYAVVYYTWHIFAIVGFNLLWFSSISLVLSHELHRPRERKFRLGLQAWLFSKLKNSISLIYSLMVWNQHRLAYLISKGVSVILLFALLYSQKINPMPIKGVHLSLFSIACLQGIIAYWMQQSVNAQFMMLRNLPIPRYQRFFQYAGAALILWIPEGLMMIVLLSSLSLPMIWGLEYAAAISGIYLLTIALLHYKLLPLTQYLSYLFWFFVLAFFVLMFNAPTLGVYGFCLILAWAMFWEEF